MKKILSILFFVALFCIAPMLAKPELLLHWQFILLVAGSTVLLATQPRLSVAESKATAVTDAWTIWFIMAVSASGLTVSLVEWAYFDYLTDLTNDQRSFFTRCGLCMIVAGIAFRVYAIHVLGKYFTATVQIKREHRIVTSGPYGLLRHPSYTGAYIALLGAAIFVQSVAGVFILGIGLLYVYYLRIRVEEETLTEAFKGEYTAYCQRTWKMFPCVW